MSKTKSPKPFRVSDESINCYNLRVITAGIDTSVFLTNPVMLYRHRYGKVFGCWENFEIKGLEAFATPVFDTDSQEDEILLIAGQVERDVIRAASIGIEIQEVVWNEALKCYDVLKCLLVEISIVDIPGNRNALMLYKDGEQLTDLQLSAELERYKPSQTNTPVTMNFKALALQLGLPETATEADIQAAITGMQNKQTQLVNEAKQVKVQEAETLILAAIGDKRIKPETKEKWMGRFAANFDDAKELLAEITVPQAPANLVEFASGKKVQESQNVATSVELAAEFDTHWKGGTLANLKRDNPAKYEQLYVGKYGTKPTVV